MTPPTNRPRGELQTPLGPVAVFDWCDPAFAAGREMEAGLGTFPSYRSLFTTPQGLANLADSNNADLVLGLDREDRIVGYCLMREPDKKDFWGRLGPGTLYEIVALEVSRNFRSTKLGRRLLHLGLTNGLIDKRITFMVGYSWTWDLEGTGRTPAEYRRMLLHLLEPYGFKRFPTNEPNVSLRPENMFMARIGPEVDPELAKRFKNLLFGIV